MKLWTITCNYAATGEGQTICACIVYEINEQSAKEQFIKYFGEYFAQGCLVEEGFIENEVIKFLFSEQLINSIKHAQNKANIAIFASSHVNYS